MRGGRFHFLVGFLVGFLVPPLLGIMHAAWAGGSTDFPPFTLESSQRGINYPVQPVPQSTGLYGFGVACIDLDLDGDDDIVALGRISGQVGIYANDGTGHFTDASIASGVAPMIAGSAIAAADLDGDRLPELILSQINAPVRIYRNSGSLRFVPHLLDGWTGAPSTTKAVSLADVDGDGDLDIFVANYPLSNSPSPFDRNRLLRNDTFTLTDIAPALGMNAPARSFLGVFSDVDLDGDQDLYVSNDRGHLAPFFAANQLWINDGAGHFANGSAGSGADIACFSMGVASGDFDGNGTPDLLATNTASIEPPVYGVNPLMLGQGDGTFTRGEQLWQVQDLHSGWGALFVDLDNNGLLDLFVNHQGSANALWTNAGGAPATPIAGAAGATGVTSLWNYSTATADLDRDGDMDLVESGLGSNILVYINHAGDAVPSVRVRVEGVGRNTSAIGARVTATVGKRALVRELQAGGVGYLGQNSLEAHFGLGLQASASQVVVHFPDGVARSVGPAPAGAYLVVHPELLGDGNLDHALTDADRAICVACLDAGGVPHAGGPCARFDFNGDLRLDAGDRPLFEAALAHARADLDGNRVVDARDLTVLLSQWGTPGSADMDRSGLVDAPDIALLLASWG